MRIATKYSINEVLDCVIKNGNEENKIRARVVKIFICVLDKNCRTRYFVQDMISPEKVYAFQLEERR